MNIKYRDAKNLYYIKVFNVKHSREETFEKCAA